MISIAYPVKVLSEYSILAWLYPYRMMQIVEKRFDECTDTLMRSASLYSNSRSDLNLPLDYIPEVLSVMKRTI